MEQNIFGNLPQDRSQEHFQDLISQPGVRLERIVSYGQTTPEGEWYDQNWDEWVMVLQGEAKLRLESQPELVVLQPGDHILLPAGCRHRVEYCSPDQPVVWLALHINEPVSG